MSRYISLIIAELPIIIAWGLALAAIAQARKNDKQDLEQMLKDVKSRIAIDEAVSAFEKSIERWIDRINEMYPHYYPAELYKKTYTQWSLTPVIRQKRDGDG